MAAESVPEGVPLATTESLSESRVTAYVQLVAVGDSAPGRAVERLAEHAYDVGADAVLAVRMTSSASGGVFISDPETFAYGTAVTFQAG